MYKKILVPLDGSNLAECVLTHLDTVARGCGTESVTFIRVVEPLYPAMSADPDAGYTFSVRDWHRLEEEQKNAATGYLTSLAANTRYDDVKINTEVLYGKAAESIADYGESNSFDLILIATHGRSGVSRWVWGSVADKVLRTACVPILMIRAPGCTPKEVAAKFEVAAAPH